jgi:hypothetical protein
MPYIQVKLKISPKQQAQALKGAKIRLTPDAIGSGEIVLLHPLNARKIANAKSGINLELSPGEIMNTASFHNMMPKMESSELSGSGIFDTIFQGLKKVGQFLKTSGIGTILADSAQAAATPFVGSQVAGIGRQLVKQATGVGLKGSPAKKRGSGLYTSKGSGLYV